MEAMLPWRQHVLAKYQDIVLLIWRWEKMIFVVMPRYIKEYFRSSYRGYVQRQTEEFLETHVVDFMGILGVLQLLS